MTKLLMERTDLGCGEDVLDRLRDLWSNAIAFDQGDGKFALAARVSLYIDGVHGCMHANGEVHQGPCFL